MKNSFNLGFIVLVLAVLGCSCPKLNELANKDNSSSPSPTPYVTGSPGSTTTPPANKTTSSSALTKENFTRIKNGMSYKQVVEILGSEGEETSSSEIGRYKVASYKWSGPDYSMIYGVFTNDKLTSKTQANLK
jgi:hypothetical protein